MTITIRCNEIRRVAVIFTVGLILFAGLAFTFRQALAIEGSCVQSSGTCGNGSSPGGGKVVIPSGPSPQQLRYRQAQELNSTGVQFSRNKEYAKAIEYYRRALILEPNDPTVQKNLRDAESLLKNQFGLVAYSKGDYATAASFFRQSLAIWPNESIVQQNLRKAEDYLKREINAKLYKHKLADSNNRINRMLDDISTDFSTAPSLSDSTSKDSLSFMSSGEPRYSKGTKQSAPVNLSFMGSTNTPAKSGPTTESPANKEIDVFENSEDPKDAPRSAPTVSMVQKAKEAKSVMYIIGGKGFSAVSSLSPEVTRTEVEKALNHLPMKARAHALLGATAVKLGRYDEAIAQLEKAEKSAPDDQGIKKAIGHVLAIKDGKQPLKANPKTQILLDALEEGQGDWNSSIAYMRGLLSQEKDPQKISDITENIKYVNEMGTVDLFIKGLIDEKYGYRERELNNADDDLDNMYSRSVMERRKKAEHEKMWDQIIGTFSK